MLHILQRLLLKDLWDKLFAEIHTINEVDPPKPVLKYAGKGKWARCPGTGKSMLDMHKVDGRWFGTCAYCLKTPILSTKHGVTWPHKEMTPTA